MGGFFFSVFRSCDCVLGGGLCLRSASCGGFPVDVTPWFFVSSFVRILGVRDLQSEDVSVELEKPKLSAGFRFAFLVDDSLEVFR